jgi:hypothetical protein
MFSCSVVHCGGKEFPEDATVTEERVSFGRIVGLTDK